MREGTHWFLVPPTSELPAWSPRCRPSADTSRDRGVLRPKASWGWRLFSTTMKEPRRGVRRPDFYLQPLGPGARWENVVTVRSTRLARMYEPGVWAPRIGPKPLMMIVATQDTVTLTDLALEAYERAHQPKKLVMIPGGHFDPYLSGFNASCGAALQWFQEHLGR